MNALVYRAPRLQRFKALIGTLMATAALGGLVQAAVPASASAQRSMEEAYCAEVMEARGMAEWFGARSLVQYYTEIAQRAGCLPE